MKYLSDQINSQSAFMQAEGNATTYRSKTVLAAAIVLNDTIDLIRVPAGTFLDSLRLKNDDLDSGTSLQVSLGYRPADPNSSMSTQATYFGSTMTQFQAASSAVAPFSPQFAPLKLDEDIIIYATVTAAPAGGGTGTIYTWAGGEAIGIK